VNTEAFFGVSGQEIGSTTISGRALHRDPIIYPKELNRCNCLSADLRKRKRDAIEMNRNSWVVSRAVCVSKDSAGRVRRTRRMFVSRWESNSRHKQADGNRRATTWMKWDRSPGPAKITAMLKCWDGDQPTRTRASAAHAASLVMFSGA